MSSEEPPRPTSFPPGQQTEEEIRALLLRLLRLVAAEVAEQLRRSERRGQPLGSPPEDSDPESLRGGSSS